MFVILIKLIIEIKRNLTTIAGGKGSEENINKQIDYLKTQIEQSESLYECEKIQERITRLTCGVSIIYVGASTEVELIEKRHRIEDALESVKSAQEDGIIPGGGIGLLHASRALTRHLGFHDDVLGYGFKIVHEAIQEPIKKILSNAGKSSDLIIEKIYENNNNDLEYGYNVINDRYINMFKEGIIDPVKVTKCALSNAASVACALIISECAIYEIPS
jgi:chaperonin GroEL